MALIDEGDIDGALDLCADMHLESDTAQSRQIKRQIVNILIVMLHTPQEFDQQIFAEGAVQQMKSNTNNEHELNDLMEEEEATELMLQLQQKKLEKAAKEAISASNMVEST